jgi:hypothetical protein
VLFVGIMPGVSFPDRASKNVNGGSNSGRF